MHILYIHQHFSTPQGASGTRSYEFARHLVLAGHRVTMVCGANQLAKTGLEGDFIRGYREGIVGGIDIIEIGVPYSNHDNFLARAWKFCAFAFKATRLALTRQYDVIFATSTPLTVAIPGIFAKWLRRKPFVFEVRDLWPELPKAMGVITNKFILFLMTMLEWLAYHSANHCIALSPGIQQGIERRGIKAQRITLIPNGCDVAFFADARKKALPGFKQTDFIAVFTGAHGMANGLDAVLDAAKIAKQKAGDIKFLFIGDGKLKPHLVHRATQERLSNCVFWEPMAKTKLRDVLKAVDVGMMILSNVPAFYRGTSPNKFFDYIASGLPVLNNYPGWLHDLIVEYHCGVTVEPNDPNAFAGALISLSKKQKQLVTMGENARRLAETQFDRQKLADAFLMLLKQV